MCVDMCRYVEMADLALVLLAAGAVGPGQVPPARTLWAQEAASGQLTGHYPALLTVGGVGLRVLGEDPVLGLGPRVLALALDARLAVVPVSGPVLLVILSQGQAQHQDHAHNHRPHTDQHWG